ncbi:DUF4157 domain-containing protein [Halobacterium salinarum]|nr:DUF4157 domain-containing protein [Halobacterium salinarum]
MSTHLEVTASTSSCQDTTARAFTVGNHVAFNHGEYNPQSQEGQHVLAHELAHVRQQSYVLFSALTAVYSSRSSSSWSDVSWSAARNTAG